jgi:streptomycin 6-kinase
MTDVPDAVRKGLDPAAAWEWGVAERVASGLLCTQIHLQPLGRDALRAAEAVAGLSM